MDYNQPSAYVERIKDPANCSNTLQKLVKGNLSQREISEIALVHPIISIEDRLAHFPSPGARQVPNIRENVSAPFFHRFYKYPKSERDWDFALVIARNGVPAGIYYSRGEIISRYSLVVPGDIIFDFYQNPLDLDGDNFDLETLKLYISRALAVCTDKTRASLDKEFKSKSKKQEPQNKENQRQDIPPQRNLQIPRQQKFIRQKRM